MIVRQIQFDQIRKRVEIANPIDTINRQFQRREIDRRQQTQIGYVQYICENKINHITTNVKRDVLNEVGEGIFFLIGFFVFEYLSVTSTRVFESLYPSRIPIDISTNSFF